MNPVQVQNGMEDLRVSLLRNAGSDREVLLGVLGQLSQDFEGLEHLVYGAIDSKDPENLKLILGRLTEVYDGKTSRMSCDLLSERDEIDEEQQIRVGEEVVQRDRFKYLARDFPALTPCLVYGVTSHNPKITFICQEEINRTPIRLWENALIPTIEAIVQQPKESLCNGVNLVDLMKAASEIDDNTGMLMECVEEIVKSSGCFSLEVQLAAFEFGFSLMRRSQSRRMLSSLVRGLNGFCQQKAFYPDSLPSLPAGDKLKRGDFRSFFEKLSAHVLRSETQSFSIDRLVLRIAACFGMSEQKNWCLIEPVLAEALEASRPAVVRGSEEPSSHLVLKDGLRLLLKNDPVALLRHGEVVDTVFDMLSVGSIWSWATSHLGPRLEQFVNQLLLEKGRGKLTGVLESQDRRPLGLKLLCLALNDEENPAAGSLLLEELENGTLGEFRKEIFSLPAPVKIRLVELIADRRED